MAVETTGNLILDTLSPELLASLNPREEFHPIGVVLITPVEIPEFVFFPHRGAVVSIVCTTLDGTMVESGIIGHEGMMHLQNVIAVPAPNGTEALVQIDGRFTRTDLAAVRALFRDNAQFREQLLPFANLFLDQVTQNLVCNRLHPIEQRLAKWLLTVRDRIDTDELHLTHEFLAHMLGIHRPGVSIAVSALELDGLIRHGRNLIALRDHEGLLERTCECYGALHRKLRAFTATFDV
jgi:CRP-like cAMP-binding protein